MVEHEDHDGLCMSIIVAPVRTLSQFVMMTTMPGRVSSVGVYRVQINIMEGALRSLPSSVHRFS